MGERGSGDMTIGECSADTSASLYISLMVNGVHNLHSPCIHSPCIHNYTINKMNLLYHLTWLHTGVTKQVHRKACTTTLALLFRCKDLKMLHITEL